MLPNVTQITLDSFKKTFLNINRSKCSVMLFEVWLVEPWLYIILILMIILNNDIYLPLADFTKHLEITVDLDLKFKKHVSMLI